MYKFLPQKCPYWHAAFFKYLISHVFLLASGDMCKLWLTSAHLDTSRTLYLSYGTCLYWPVLHSIKLDCNRAVYETCYYFRNFICTRVHISRSWNNTKYCCIPVHFDTGHSITIDYSHAKGWYVSFLKHWLYMCHILHMSNCLVYILMINVQHFDTFYTVPNWLFTIHILTRVILSRFWLWTCPCWYVHHCSNLDFHVSTLTLVIQYQFQL